MLNISQEVQFPNYIVRFLFQFLPLVNYSKLFIFGYYFYEYLMEVLTLMIHRSSISIFLGLHSLRQRLPHFFILHYCTMDF